MAAELLDFSPLALVEDDFGSYERAVRLRAVRGLQSVARAIGEVKTRTELLTVVTDRIAIEEEDEVLYAIAGVLGAFVGELGGVEYANLLFAPLRDLARVEETMVHTKATKSLCTAFDAVGGECANASEAAEQALAAIKVLAADAGFGAKVSAARLVPPAARLLVRCGAADQRKIEAIEVLSLLAKDDSPTVRRAAAAEISALVSAIASPELFAAALTGVIAQLVADEHDSVRLVALLELGAILGAADGADALAWQSAVAERGASSCDASDATEGEGEAKEESSAEVHPKEAWRQSPVAMVALGAYEDASWRVRESLAASFPGLFVHFARCADAAAGSEQQKAAADLGAGLLSVFARLLGDPEVEVRVAAFKATHAVCAARRLAVAQHADCVDALARGAEATELKVRVAAARALTRLLATLSPGNADFARVESECASLVKAQKQLFAVVQARLFTDEHVDVTLATLTELAQVVPLLDLESAEKVATLVESSEHENWRVRKATNVALPAIAARRGKEAFEAQLLEGYVRSFQDRICMVRSSAVEALAQLRELKDAEGAPVLDADWLMDKVGKRLSELYLTMSYYLYRITIVQAFEKLASGVLAEPHMETIVVFLVDAARDDVPNVRFTAVTALATACKYATDRLVTNYVKPVFNELQNDPDDDVKRCVTDANTKI